MDAPAALTPERIDAMLSIMAEVCLESVVEAGRFQKAAEDVEAFERGGRALQRACRNLRQTIAMKQRHDREQAARADEGRRQAQAERALAEQARRHRADQKVGDLQRHFERVLWDEYEPSDAQELFEELAMRVKDAGFEDDFLDTPVETLIARFADEIGLGAASRPLPLAERGWGGGETPAAPSAPPPPPLPREGEERSATVPPETPQARPAEAAQPPPHPPPEPPPELPPGPRAEPYVPPWEHLRRGQSMPGDTGW